MTRFSGVNRRVMSREYCERAGRWIKLFLGTLSCRHHPAGYEHPGAARQHPAAAHQYPASARQHPAVGHHKYPAVAPTSIKLQPIMNSCRHPAVAQASNIQQAATRSLSPCSSDNQRQPTVSSSIPTACSKQPAAASSNSLSAASHNQAAREIASPSGCFEGPG